jgi:hypothetical protein
MSDQLSRVPPVTGGSSGRWRSTRTASSSATGRYCPDDPKTLWAHRERRVDRRQGGKPDGRGPLGPEGRRHRADQAIGTDVARAGVLVNCVAPARHRDADPRRLSPAHVDSSGSRCGGWAPPDEGAAPRDDLAWPWPAGEASAARDGTVQRGRGLGAHPTVDGETIRFLECDDSRFRTPTEGPVGRTGVVAGP